ncbi:MBL fold metallo-hydrolase [Bombella saccharophila]|uniref:MBL fold metallo-hydrolase n=1 Tax=Bombella saccharophila TaxID=2967338 RepID=A0ABT3W8W8_9PROT|nr:MBL fold metallo-hydrolase [Bombella saccharophila]MCX5614252.1 MBL fold metallo-hydrolase [Bombella saccharophila]
MKVTILGCGGSAGVPMIGGAEGAATGIWGVCDPANQRNYRLRSSIVIEHEGFRLLVDSGPDLRQQMLHNGLTHIDAVFYTHAHSDHIAGLDELRAVNRVIGRPIQLLASQAVLSELRQRFSYAFRPWEGGNFYCPAFDVREVPDYGPVSLGPLTGHIFPQKHGWTRSLGLRVGDFAYCTDVESFPPESLTVLQNLSMWVVGCFQRKAHPSHGWVGRVLEWREQLRPRHTVLTHMGPDMDYESLCRLLPEDVRPAWDGMVLSP